ncbi:MAG: hypothetical protein KDD15_27015, partial [Lewinella sp.]|nr:hypothetical protein [Lewinella sp.]
MKSLTISLLILLPFLANGQTRIDTLFAVADHHFQNKNYDRAQELYGNLKSVLDKGTNDYNYAADQIAMIRFFDRDALRQQGKYRESINYLMDFIRYIEEEREFIRPLWYDEKRYFLIKTIIQNYFALGELEKARIYQDMLYAAYRAKLLPEGIDEYYSFEMFRWQDKNVWGYEWYPELGDPEAEGSFSKIIYFVYSTDEAGQDKDQLFRLHVLKVHKI